MVVDYRLASAGAIQPTWNASRSAQWNAVAVAFKAAGEPTAPVCEQAPTVSAVATVDETISVTPGEWSGTVPISFAYQWNKNGVPIAGQTNATLLVSEDLLGAEISCTERAINDVGVTSATSSTVIGSKIGVVQYASQVLYHLGAGTSSVSLSNVREGATLVLLMGHGQASSNSAPTIEGSMSAADMVAASVNTSRHSSSGGVYPSRTRVYVKQNVAAGSHTVSITIPAEYYGQATLMEVVGAANDGVDVVQDTGFGDTLQPGDGQVISTGQSDMTSTPNQLVCAVFLQTTSSTEGTTVITPPSGYEQMAWVVTALSTASAFKVVHERAAQECTWNTNKYNAWTAVLITIKAAPPDFNSTAFLPFFM